jgi:PAS domain S-box-containing protein
MADITKIGTFIQSSPHPAWLATTQGHCVYANPALERLTGFNSDQINQADWRSFLLEEDRAVASASWQRSLATGTPYRVQVRMRGSDGAPECVELIAFGHKAGDGTELWLFTGLDVNGVAAQKSPELEAQLQATLNVIPADTWYALPSGALLFVNERTANYLGLPKDHPLRFGTDVGAEWDSYLLFLHPDDHEENRRVWSTSLRTGCAGEVTSRVRTAEGAYRWFLCHFEPLRANDGTLLYWIGVNLDIDDRKRAGDALRKSEKELRDVIDTIPAVVWSALPSGLNSYKNSRFVEYSGMSAEQTAGLGWQAAIHPDDLERHAGKWMEAVATGKPHENEVRFRRSDGQYRWHLDRGVPLRDEDGNIVKWYGVTTDIEDRKRAEEALMVLSRDLQESKAKLEEAQRITHVGYWEWDILTGRVNWSDETYRIYGLRPQERSMDLDTVQEKVHPEDWQRGMEEALGSGRFNAECRLFRPTGEVRIAHFQGDVNRDASGRPYRMFGTIQDITDRKRAQEALQQNQFYLAEGQRLAHMGSWAFNPSGFFEYWSQELFKIYGLDPQKGAPTLEQYLATVHPADRDFMAETIRRMHAERSGCDVKKRIVRPDGELRYIRCVGIPVVEGEVLKGFLGTAIDITEQELLTHELELRQAHLTEAQKLTHTGSWVWRVPDRNAVHLSEEWYRIYGFDPAEGAPAWEKRLERVHPEDRLKWKGRIDRAIVEKADYDLEFRIRFPNGKVKWIHTVGHPVLSNTGDLEQFVGCSTDITERKSAEQALQRSEAYLAEAQRLSHTGSWASNPASNITYWSEECYRVLGFTPGDGTPPAFETIIQRIHPDDQAQCRERVEKGIHDKVDFELDYRIVHPDKRVRDIHCVCHTVLDGSGDLVELVGTVIDVTERKSAEQEREKLRQLEADLAHTNRVSTLGEMAASLAHEIKQPITAAITSANSCIEWLAHEPPNLDRARAAAARIDKYGNRAAEIIDRIRSFYKKSPPQRELVDVNGIIHELLTLLKGEASRFSVAMRTDLSPELPKIMVDRVQLQQVIMNLMLNAIEAMKDSGGELTVKAELQDGQLQFSVSDTGVGLPMEKMDQIFSAFFTTKPQGSGMGLAISRSIVESHGGQLWASANSGGGASFHCTLPIQVTESSPLVA